MLQASADESGSFVVWRLVQPKAEAFDELLLGGYAKGASRAMAAVGEGAGGADDNVDEPEVLDTSITSDVSMLDSSTFGADGGNAGGGGDDEIAAV